MKSKKKILLVLGAILILLITCAILVGPKVRMAYHAAFATPVLTAAVGPSDYTSSSDGIEVHYIDVGDSDCTLIIADGHAMLIDGGNIGDTTARDYLEAHGIKKLDFMVGTHAHADHMGGLSDVLEAIEVERVLASPYGTILGVYKHLVREVEKKGLHVEAPKVGDTFELGGATVTVMSPRENYRLLNDTSLVLRIEYGEMSFLVEGDAQEDAEKGMIEDGLAKKVTVLRCGHHGSNNANSVEYLAILKPDYAVISCGENKYGHPHGRMLGRLEKIKTKKIYRTDQNGTIVAKSDGKTIEFTMAK